MSDDANLVARHTLPTDDAFAVLCVQGDDGGSSSGGEAVTNGLRYSPPVQPFESAPEPSRPEQWARLIEELAAMPEAEFNRLCENSSISGYDWDRLNPKLLGRVEALLAQPGSSN